MLIFSRRSFLDTVFLKVSHTCSSDYSVYDGRCTYTHILHAHFSAHSACTVTFAHFHACAHARMAQAQVVSKRCLLHMYHTSPSRLLYLMFHPSLLFLYIHFDIPFQSTILPYFPVLKAQDMRHSAFASRSLATVPRQMQTHVQLCQTMHCADDSARWSHVLCSWRATSDAR